MKLHTSGASKRKGSLPHTTWRLVPALIAFLGSVSAATAQEPVAKGDVVRVWTLDSGRHSPYTGTVVGVAGDTIFLVPRKQSDSLALLHREIARLLVRHEKRLGASAAWGALIGTLAGAGIAAIVVSQTEADYGGFEIYAGVAGAAAGLLGGTVIGLAVGADRWREVPLRPFPQGALLEPTRVRIGIAVRL